MKKRVLSLMCVSVLLLGLMSTAFGLKGESRRAADTLATLGLIQAVETDTALAEAVTRVQTAVVLAHLSGMPADGTETADKTETFAGGTSGSMTDVPDWATAEVQYVLEQGWMTADKINVFDPNGVMTTQESMIALLRMLGYREEDGDFVPEDAVAFARRIGLTTRTYSRQLSQGYLYELIRDTLPFHYKDSEETVIDRLVKTGKVSAATANALGLQPSSLTARQVSDRLTSAVFQMDVYEKEEEIKEKNPASNSSGFFVTEDGIAITSYHCIQDGIYATATLISGDQYPVERVLYYDQGIDIAVIRVSRMSLKNVETSRFATLELAGIEDIRVGDTVYALGNPLGLGLTISEGIISDTARDVDTYDLPCIMDTADISKGSSGGALLNECGQVIGVTSGAYVYGNNMYLSVPVDPAMNADWTVEGQTLAEVTEIEQAKAEAEEKAAEESGETPSGEDA